MAKRSLFSDILRRSDEVNSFPLDEYVVYNDLVDHKVTMLQNQYKKLGSHKLQTRKQILKEASMLKNSRKYKKELSDLKAQIYVAQGTTHMRQNALNMNKLRCHVACQEKLDEEIEALRNNIANMEREVGQLKKDNLILNMKLQKSSITPEKIKKEKRILESLENTLEVFIQRECTGATKNDELRFKIDTLLHQRTKFNAEYSMLMQQLNSGKKYFVEVQEYALHGFENCILTYNRINDAYKQHNKEKHLLRKEIDYFINHQRHEQYLSKFSDCKDKEREWLPLQPKEVRRREKFRVDNEQNIKDYKRILQKIFQFTNSNKLGQVVDKYHDAEGLYYSYFTYSNEMSYHITLMDNKVNRLHNDVGALRALNGSTMENQFHLIEEYEATLQKKQEANQHLTGERNEVDRLFKTICQDFDELIALTKCDISSLKELLGANKVVSLPNIRLMLQKFQDRLNDVLAVVYAIERDAPRRKNQKPIFRELTVHCERPTKLDEIVLAQQCAECGEGEAVNTVDNTEATILTKTEVKKLIYEKVTQPELQYRLHSIAECRLPRSKMLAAKLGLQK